MRAQFPEQEKLCCVSKRKDCLALAKQLFQMKVSTFGRLELQVQAGGSQAAPVTVVVVVIVIVDAPHQSSMDGYTASTPIQRPYKFR